MSQIKEKKTVLIDAVLHELNIPNTTETVLQLDKLSHTMLQKINRGITAMQSKRLTEYD